MTIKEIDSGLEEGYSLKYIAQAYSEIANLKIKRIRNEVERNRRFFDEISYVYGLVKVLADKKKVTIQKSKKIISVLITSNYRFYGNINSALIDFFVASTEKFALDRLIIGKAAIDYFKAQPPRHWQSYEEILLTADMPSPAELRDLVSILKDYDQVVIFFSKLKSLLTQQPETIDLSTTQQRIITSSQPDFRFIFEPELPQILAFFDSQIITLLLEEAFLEAEASRTASRFISMDQAETEANKFIKEYTSLKAYAKKSMDNNKILENYAIIKAVTKEVEF